MYGLQTKGLYSDFSNAISDLPHGEYLQIMARKSIEKWKEGAEMDKLWFEYLEKTHYKTGSLFSHLLAGAARCSKSQSYSVEDLISFAVNLGLSFQIADDLKDVVMTTKDQTKDSLNDLRERNTTAPYLFTLMELMRTNRQGEAKELIAILS